jgi:hypothetical protein
MLEAAVVLLGLVSILSLSKELCELSTEPGANWAAGEMGGGPSMYGDVWCMLYVLSGGKYKGWRDGIGPGIGIGDGDKATVGL